MVRSGPTVRPASVARAGRCRLVGRRVGALVRRVVGTATAGLLLAGCAGPMLTADAYRDGANESARQTASIVQTAMLAAEADLGGRALGAYADTTVSNAETDARSVQTTFDSRQPPDAASLDLRGKIHGPLDAAVDGLEALRIALRRGDERAVRAELVRLSTVGDQLSRIEQETEA